MKSNPLVEKSQELSFEILSLCSNLSTVKGIANILNQLSRSGTSVNANIREANYPHSLSDMLAKLRIALKECYETEGWLLTLFDHNHIPEATFKPIRNKAGAIRRMLIASCKTIEGKLS